ncbi:MAG: hybrid sensor histidine kinase/response regulator [Bacteroidales bacterium]|nr:hybrid sensor histidine kinase/response regulator [Bacteroidales bacterium]
MEKINGNNFTILIVDDTPKNLQVLGNTLRQNNYKVEFAINGEKALDWVKKKKFDLILLDIMMPEMDGYEVCKIIREDETNNNIPIIFLTAKTDAESVIKGFEMGAQDYVTKPFSTSELLTRVKTQLDLKSSKEKLQSVNKWLEQKVQERTIELQKSNEKLEKANRELLNLENAKDEFLSIISHEIRTPMNGILGTLHLLKDMAETKQIIKLVNILDDSVKRLERFSTMALQITSLRTNKQKLKIQEISLKEVIEFSLIDLSEKLKEKNIKININGTKEKPVIHGDYDLMMMCSTKIFENAIKYSKSEGTIFINIIEDEKNLICEITDQGEGFSDYILKNQLTREPGLIKKGENKPGIDLTLIKLIIDAHSGKLELSNSSEGGAVVKIIFNKNN